MFSHGRWPAVPSTAQAVGSSTFTPPPFDWSLGLHEIYDFHLEHSSTHPLFIWEPCSTSSVVQALTWGEVARATHRAAYYIKNHAQTPVGVSPPVIAILAFTDTVTSVCLMLGLIRAGYQCFWISPRNSVAGVRHLLETVGASELIIHRDGTIKALATAAVSQSRTPVHTLPLPEFWDLFPQDDSNFEPYISPPFEGIDTPAIIMHSSGSTSFPKARTFTHRILIQQCHVPWFGQVDLCDEILATHAVPMFHAQGLYNICLPVTTGLILSVFPPDTQASLPTPEKLIQGIEATGSTMLITVPSFLEYWARYPQNVRTLSRLKTIFCGGALLNKESTIIYRENGINIRCYLAATEYGIATLLAPKQTLSQGSEWFTFSPHLTPMFLPQDDPKVFELIFLASPIHTPVVVNTQFKGRDAYATGDLVTRHPSNPRVWKIHGRLDDQIMLSTGEKTNPGPIESIIARSPYVKTCVMFGRGRFQNGIIIEPTKPFDFSDTEALSRFRNDIWPAVEEANKYAPSHSRIFKEMIIVAHPSKPFEATLKNTPKRQLVIATYQTEIEAAYSAVAESAQADISPPADWTFEETLVFVRRVVSEVLIPDENPLQDDDDLFSRGADSLQATWIRNSILRALRESSKLAVAKELPLNFVYEHPSIEELARYLMDVLSGHGITREITHSDRASKLERMEDLVVKYTTNFPIRPASNGYRTTDVPSGEVVVLTGSTGSLGAQILASLVQDIEVTRIYSLNRRRAAPVKMRQMSLWDDQGLDPLLLKSEKLIFVETEATEGLGISKDILDEIRTSVTLIIHNAWTVDFNQSLSSFVSNLQALRTLMDLALQSPRTHPPRFVFVSTIGVLGGWTGPAAVPEAPVPDMALSLGSGYTESKCVAERIVGSQSTVLRTIVVRVGQLSGAPNGSWRTTEWLPTLVSSGKMFGMLPDVEGVVSWIPLHAAATGLLEVARTDDRTSGTTFAHIVHPRPVTWKTIFRPLSEALGVPLVPYDEWLERLEQYARAGGQIPAVKLLGFFRSVRPKGEGEGEGEALGFPTLETTETISKAPRSLGELDILGPENVMKWIRHWRGKGFL